MAHVPKNFLSEFEKIHFQERTIEPSGRCVGGAYHEAKVEPSLRECMFYPVSNGVRWKFSSGRVYSSSKWGITSMAKLPTPSQSCTKTTFNQPPHPLSTQPRPRINPNQAILQTHQSHLKTHAIHRVLYGARSPATPLKTKAEAGGYTSGVGISTAKETGEVLAPYSSRHSCARRMGGNARGANGKIAAPRGRAGGAAGERSAAEWPLEEGNRARAGADRPRRRRKSFLEREEAIRSWEKLRARTEEKAKIGERNLGECVEGQEVDEGN